MADQAVEKMPCDDRRKPTTWDKVIRIGIVLSMVISASALLGFFISDENRKTVLEQTQKSQEREQKTAMETMEKIMDLKIKPVADNVEDMRDDLKEVQRDLKTIIQRTR